MEALLQHKHAAVAGELDYSYKSRLAFFVRINSYLSLPPPPSYAESAHSLLLFERSEDWLLSTTSKSLLSPRSIHLAMLPSTTYLPLSPSESFTEIGSEEETVFLSHTGPISLPPPTFDDDHLRKDGQKQPNENGDETYAIEDRSRTEDNTSLSDLRSRNDNQDSNESEVNNKGKNKDSEDSDESSPVESLTSSEQDRNEIPRAKHSLFAKDDARSQLHLSSSRKSDLGDMLKLMMKNSGDTSGEVSDSSKKKKNSVSKKERVSASYDPEKKTIFVKLENLELEKYFDELMKFIYGIDIQITQVD